VVGTGDRVLVAELGAAHRRRAHGTTRTGDRDDLGMVPVPAHRAVAIQMTDFDPPRSWTWSGRAIAVAIDDARSMNAGEAGGA
jgi:hypothetical protein